MLMEKRVKRNLETEAVEQKKLTGFWIFHNTKLDNLKYTQEKVVGSKKQVD